MPFQRILAAASFLFVLISADAQKLLTSRTFSGSGSDSPAAIAADAQGNVYVAGTTTSADLPASHGFQPKPAVMPLSISADGGATFMGVTIPDVSEIDALAASSSGTVLYAGTPSGLFRSDNGGTTWSATKPGIPVSAQVLAIGSADSNLVYAGAKSGFYRSTDGGNNWTLIPSPMSQNLDAIFYQIAVDPLRPSNVWATATNVPNPSGVYASTDGGGTFTAITLPPQGFNPYSNATSVAFDPSHEGTVYASGQSSPIFKSTDSGATWNVLAQIYGSVTVDPSNSSILYALNGLGLQKSTDGGLTFSKIGDGSIVNEFAVDPSNSSRLYAASMQALYTSADGGVTFTTTSIPAVSQIVVVAGRILVNTLIPPQAYVAKFSPDLSQLLWATYLGGIGYQAVSGLAVDASGNAYVTGTTNAPDFPVTAGVLQTGGAAFVSKISSDGSRLLASTFVGTASTSLNTIAVDRSGAVYLAGIQNGAGLVPSSEAFQTAIPGPCQRPPDPVGFYPLSTGAGFVTKISADFSKVIYSTYLTGTCGSDIFGMQVDDSGVATVVGGTFSLDFPVTPGAMMTTAPGTDESGLLTQIAADGGSLIYSTFLGGGTTTEAHAFLTNRAGNWVVTGGGSPAPTPGSAHRVSTVTCATSFLLGPGPPIPRPPTPGEDAFVMVFNAHSTSPILTAAVGGSCLDEGDSIALDGADNIWIAGLTSSDDLATRSMVGGLGGGGGGFLAAFTPAGDTLLSNGYVGPAPRLVSAGGRVSASAATIGAPLPSGYNKYTTALAAFDAVSAPEVQIDTLAAYSGNGSLYAVAPGQVILIDGRGFGSSATQPGTVKNGSVTNSIGGTQVTFDGIAAPLLTLQDQSVALVVPFELQSPSTTVQVLTNGEPVSNPVSLPVNTISPDVLLVVNSDGTVNSAQHPAPVGSTIAMFVTGLGAENPSVPDGSVATAASTSPPVLVGPHVMVGSVPVQVSYVGAAVGLVAGIVQVNLPVPDVNGPDGKVLVQATQFSVYIYVSQ